MSKCPKGGCQKLLSFTKGGPPILLTEKIAKKKQLLNMNMVNHYTKFHQSSLSYTDYLAIFVFLYLNTMSNSVFDIPKCLKVS